MEKLSGNANEWSGWLYKLKVCADAMDEEFGEAVRDIAKAKIAKDDVDLVKFEEEEEPYNINTKFFEIPCGPT